MSTKDGGPAFPNTAAVGPSGDVYWPEPEGMSLEPRYSSRPIEANTQRSVPLARQQSRAKRTYECDVCVRCGHVVQPEKTEPAHD